MEPRAGRDAAQRAGVSFGLSAPLVGWLLDRVEARLVIIAGAAAGGLAFLVASQSNSFGLMLVAYLGIGVAVAAGTMVPASFVIANWFEPRRRGLAMGVTFAGTTVGGAVMTQVVNYSIQYSGWRAAYAALAVPAFVVVIPLVFIMVRSRPPGALQMTVAAARAHLPGLETSAAVKTRSFWMIVLAQFCFAFAAAGAVIHLVTYLEGVGYSRSGAAWVMSCVFALTSMGKVSMGMFADRASARIALTVNFIAQVIGLFLALGAHNTAIGVSFILVFGLTAGSPVDADPVADRRIDGAQTLRFYLGADRAGQYIGRGTRAVGGGLDLRRNLELHQRFRVVHGCARCGRAGLVHVPAAGG